jgi:cleavage and polyadenylation specificity factor subunit 2
MFFAPEPKVEWDEYGEIISPDDFRDTSLASSRQARKQLTEDGDGDENMEDEEEENDEEVVDTRPTKTVTEEVTITVRCLVWTLRRVWC